MATFKWHSHTSFSIKDDDLNEAASACLGFDRGLWVCTASFMTVDEAKAFTYGLVVLTHGGIHDDGGPLPEPYEIGV